MPRPAHPFQNAALALLLAIGLPTSVGLFGVVRARQLQSTANPRWAQFARGTSTDSHSVSAKPGKRRPVQTANAALPGLAIEAQTVAEITRLPAATFTGSVTGRRSFEAQSESRPVPSEVAQSLRPADLDVEEMPPIVFRPVDDESSGAGATQLFGRLETQLSEVRQRLDHLTLQQQEREAEVIQREQQILVALKGLSGQSHSSSSGRDDETEPAIETDPIPVKDLPSADDEPPFLTEPEHKPDSGDRDPGQPAAEMEDADGPQEKLPVAADPDIPPGPRGLGEVIELEFPETSGAADSEGVDSKSAKQYDDVQPSIRIRRTPSRSGSGGMLPETYSIDVHDADIKQVLIQLGEEAGISVIPSPAIQGQISLTLHDVRFETALMSIAKSRDYVVERDDGVVIVWTAEQVERRKLLNRQQVMKIYRPNYLGAAEFVRLIEPLLSADGRYSMTSATQGGLLETASHSTGPSVSGETLIVQDVPEVLQKIDQVLVEIDVAPLQVRIEAKILRVRLSEGLADGLDLAQLPCQQGGGIPHAEGGLKHASLACNVPTFIKSMERLADTSVVTSQRIQVLNRHRAEMLIGDRIGYQSKAGGEVQFTEAGTRLVLRPSISVDGFVRLEIHPELSSASVGKRAGVPRQNTTELTTQVMIRDGATVAIAGLIAEQAIETTKRVPVVGSLPVVGAPFRHKKESLQRTELIVLVTPHIITDAECDADGKCLEQATIERAAAFRDMQSPTARHNLARAHYERAACYLQQGNYVKARQQIDASLRQDKSDLEALRLRNEINQFLMP